MHYHALVAEFDTKVTWIMRYEIIFSCVHYFWLVFGDMDCSLQTIKDFDAEIVKNRAKLFKPSPLRKLFGSSPPPFRQIETF